MPDEGGEPMPSLEGLDGLALLRVLLTGPWKGRVAVTSSFGVESAVLLDLVAQVDATTPVIFLDTGELFDETVEYRRTLEHHLGLTNVIVAGPTPADKAEAEELWRRDADRCCALRKVRPLAKALRDYGVVVDGRKRSHGFDRERLSAVERVGDLLKVSPLADWSPEMVERAFEERRLPRHPLLAQGYRSVGCWPCTRPSRPGESSRAGRWAGSAKSECGIHTSRLARENGGN